MTADTPSRCEPPPGLRSVDGWHWVQLPFVSVPTPIAWMLNPDNQDREWKMPSSPAFVSGESKTAQTWHYLAPAATPAEVDALRAEVMRASTECADAMAQVVALRAHVARMEEALEDLIDVQVLSTGWDNGVTDSTGTMNEGEYLHARAFDKARAALSAETP